MSRLALFRTAKQKQGDRKRSQKLKGRRRGVKKYIVGGIVGASLLGAGALALKRDRIPKTEKIREMYVQQKKKQYEAETGSSFPSSASSSKPEKNQKTVIQSGYGGYGYSKQGGQDNTSSAGRIKTEEAPKPKKKNTTTPKKIVGGYGGYGYVKPR